MLNLIGTLIKYLTFSIVILIGSHFVTIGGLSIHKRINNALLAVQSTSVLGSTTGALKRLATDAKIGVQIKSEIPTQDQLELKKIIQSSR